MRSFDRPYRWDGGGTNADGDEHKVWLEQLDGGIVTCWEVLEGNPSNGQQWIVSLEHHQNLFGRPPDQANGYRGVHSPNNERIAQEKRVKRVILPQPGKKSEVRKKREGNPGSCEGANGTLASKDGSVCSSADQVWIAV